MRKIFLFLFLVFTQVVLFAQANATEKIVKALFDKPEKIQWLNHYQGRIDGFSEVAVSLAFDGRKCKGMLTYLRSKEAVQLDGVLKNGLLQLEEIDRNGAVSAKITGEIKGRKILAEWTNFNESVAEFIELNQVENEPESPTYCGAEMWIRSFKGQLPDDAMELIVQKVEEGQLRGIAYLRNDQKSYRVIGEINANNDYLIYLQSDDFQEVATIIGNFSDLTKQRANYHRKNGSEQYILLELQSNLYMGCIEYADYLSSYDVTYPKTKNARFNDWMDEEISNWVSSCRDYATAVRQMNSELKPAQRASLRAYAWSDIDFYSDRFISGFITFSNTWSLEAEGRAFNFDLQQGREITLADIFRKDFDIPIFVKEYLFKNQHQYRWYQDTEYRKWLAGRDFPHFTIREEGICFVTAFNPLYGRHELTISYDELKPYLKRNSPIEQIINPL